MICVEFQRALPYIIDSGGNTEHQAHLRSCPVCSDLVADLRYIAEQAKLLVPMEDPPQRVWDGIQRSLEREGLAARPTGPRGRLLGFPNWGVIPWAAVALAVIAVVGGLALYRRGNSNFATEHTAASFASVSLPVSDNSEEQQLLTAVANRSPSLRAMYEENLRRVNAYISDARERVQKDPDDPEARHFLIQAYQQKTMLYQMALGESPE